MPLQANTHAIHLKGEFEGQRSAVSTARKPSGFPSSANRSSTGGLGSDPQTRVLSTPAKLAPYKFSSLPISFSLEDLK